LAYVGASLGERWDTDPRLKLWFHRLDAVIVLVLMMGIVYFMQNHWRNRVKAESVSN
jgi:membrane protein DedA with SNARE-associated domain